MHTGVDIVVDVRDVLYVVLVLCAVVDIRDVLYVVLVLILLLT